MREEKRHADRAWLTLVMASTLAGNLTVPGSIATLIGSSVRSAGGVRVTPWEFMKVGVPSALVGLAFGAAWLALAL